MARPRNGRMSSISPNRTRLESEQTQRRPSAMDRPSEQASDVPSSCPSNRDDTIRPQQTPGSEPIVQSIDLQRQAAGNDDDLTLQQTQRNPGQIFAGMHA